MENHQFINLWAIHAKKPNPEGGEGFPFLLECQEQKEEAEALLKGFNEEIKSGDSDLEEVWMVQVTKNEAESMVRAGVLSAGIFKKAIKATF